MSRNIRRYAMTSDFGTRESAPQIANVTVTPAFVEARKSLFPQPAPEHLMPSP